MTMRNTVLKVLRWGLSSLKGSVIFFAVIFAVPEWLYFAHDLHTRGMLTPVNALVLALLCLLGGGICGALGWWTVFKPLHDRLSR
jgi:hypothetical protein